MIVLTAAFLFGILFFVIFVTQKGKIATTISVVIALLFVGSISLSIANEDFHFGMKQTTTTTKKSLVSSLPVKGMNVLLYQPLGNGKEKIYVYRTDDKQKKPTHTQADISVVNKVETGAKKAQLVHKETIWNYQNKAMRFLFKMPNDEREVIKKENIFQVPDSWLILSTTQAKRLQKEMTAAKKVMAKQAKNYVQEKVKEDMVAAMKQGKKLSANKIKSLSQKYAQEYQEQALQKMIAKVQNEK